MTPSKNAALLAVAAGLEHRNGNGLVAAPNGWPPPLGEAAYHGVAGEIVRTMEPYTEADPAALMFHFLGAIGSMVGRNAYTVAGGADHHLKIFALIVGSTSAGRKGTAWDHIKRFCKQIDEDWVRECVKGGLSSGEGLIHHVRDPREGLRKAKKDEEAETADGFVTTLEDPGVIDKRMFTIETEFGSVLGRKGREGNSLSEIIRQAWDGGDLRTLTKGEPDKATGAHVSLIGHVTPEELDEKTTAGDAANGFLNRFLFCCSRRTKFLPDEEPISPGVLNQFVRPVGDALFWANHKGPRKLRRDADANRLWSELAYAELTTRPEGRVGQVTNRAAPYVLRLAAIYALLDRSESVRPEHLRAGLEVWRYSDDSAHYIFTGTTGSQDCDRLLEGLRRRGGAGSKTQVRDDIGKNKSPDVIDAAIARAQILGYVDVQKIPSGGRPIDRIVLKHKGLSQPLQSLLTADQAA